MNYSIFRKAAEFILQHRRHRRWFRVVTSLPAITIERSAVCGMEEHIHTESCYEVYEELVCGLDGDEEHVHDSGCYDTFEELVCGMEEHIHDDSCFEQEEEPEDIPDAEEEPIGEDEPDDSFSDGEITAGEPDIGDAQDGESNAADDNPADDNPDEEEFPQSGEDDKTGKVDDTPVMTREPSEMESDPSEEPSEAEPTGEPAAEEPVPEPSRGAQEDSEPTAAAPPIPAQTVPDIPEKETKPSAGIADGGVVAPNSQSAGGGTAGGTETEKPNAAASAVPTLNTPEATEDPEPLVSATLPPEGEPTPEVTPRKRRCGIDEHAHDDNCFDIYGNLVCGIPVHRHNEYCFGPVLNTKSDDSDIRLMSADIMPVSTDYSIGGADYSFKLKADASYSLTITYKGSGALTVPSNFMAANKDAAPYRMLLKEIIINTDSPTVNFGEWAFDSCVALEKVTVPSGVTLNINGGAFSNCINLSEFNFDDADVKNVYTASLTNMPGGYSVEQGGAFYNTAFETLHLDENWSCIGDYAFYGCRNLTEAYFEENTSITGIGIGAFAFCPLLETINTENLKYPNGVWFYFNDTAKGGTFQGCSSLREITLPPGAVFTSGGSAMFMDCTSLERVTFGETSGISSFRMGTFKNCSSLKDINLTALTNLTNIEKEAFMNSGLETITIPACVEVISYNLNDSSAFENCRLLREVIFEDGSRLKRICTKAFANCSNLSAIDLSNCTILETISDHTFENCNNLEEVTIPAHLDNITSSAFNNCVNLKRMNINCTKLQWVSKASVGNIGSDLKLNIGASVDLINGDFIDGLNGYLSGLTFEGPNEFEISSASAATGLPEPLNEMAVGKYYVSDAGDLYRIDSSSGTAALVYAADKSKVSFVVPAAVGMNGEYPVTAINAYAFVDSGAVSVDFEDIDSISDINIFAFTGGHNIASINGESTVEGVKNMFAEHGLTVPDSALSDTALGGASGDFEGNKITRANGDSINLNDGEFTVTNSADSFLTGEIDNFTVNVSERGQKNVYRLYFEADSSCEFTDNVYNVSGVPFTFHRVEGTNYCYYEIGPSTEGQAVPINVTFQYLNGDADGKYVRVWAAGATKDFWDSHPEYNNAIIYPTDEIEGIETDGNYFEPEWHTQAYPYEIKKTYNSRGEQYIQMNDDGTYTLGGLKYWIRFEGENQEYLDTTREYGADYVHHVVYSDTLKLPKGLSWRNGIAEAVEKGDYYSERAGNDENIYINVDGKAYLLATLNTPNLNVTGTAVRVGEDGEITVEWTITSPHASNSMEIKNSTQNIIFGPEVIEYNEEEYGSGSGNLNFDVKNDLAAEENYHYAEPFTSEAEEAADINIAENGKFELSKVRAYSDLMRKDTDWVRYMYFGEDAGYVITAKNPSPFDYSRVDYITDPLSNLYYIKPENIQRMIDESCGNGNDFELTITHASMVGDVISDTVRAVDGVTDVELSNQSSGGHGASYSAPAATDENVLDSNAVITINAAVGEPVTLTVSGADNSGANGTYTIGVDYESIGEALNALGFVVTRSTQYSSKWYKDGLEGGEAAEFYVYSTFKDSFMMLAGGTVDYKKGDNEIYYGNSMAAEGIQNIRETVSHNYAYAYDDSGAEVARAEVEPFIDGGPISVYGVKPEISVQKDSKVNGEDFSGDTNLVDNDVIDYSVEIEHIGNGTYKTLPVADVMDGTQVLLAPVDDNADALWNSGLEVFTDEDGVRYYKLTPPDSMGESRVYEGVWFGDYFADSVTVTRTSDKNINTVTKWYFKDTIEGEYNIKIPYKALFNASEFGDGSGQRSDAQNMVYLNDRNAHRLYDYKGTSSFGFKFDKNIVNERGARPAFDELDEDKFSRVSRGDSVTYRLELTGATQDIAVTGNDLYDKLPYTASAFEWGADNLSVEYVASGIDMTLNGKPVTAEGLTGGEYSLTTVNPETSNDDDKGQQYIKWNGDWNITLKHGGTLYIYVTLTFPEGDEWDSYISTQQSEMLENVFYTFNFPKRVTHQLSDTGLAFLQKGVYEIGTYYNKSDGNPGSYFIGSDRFTYPSSVHTTSGGKRMRNGMVAYYLTVRNSSNSRMYLNKIYDKLPKGFEFHALRSNPEGDRNSWSGVGCVRNAYKENCNMFDSSSSHKTVVTVESANPSLSANQAYNSASVYLNKTDMVDGCQMLEFEIRTTKNTQFSGYDELSGYYYLEPGAYIQFAYECLTGYEEDTEIISHNAAAMELITLGQDYELDTESIVHVSDYNGRTPNNDGERYIWDGSTAAANGFAVENADSKWLASTVDVYRGSDVVPGITKTVDKQNITRAETANWTITAYNDGTTDMTDYTITDTIDAPQHLQGTMTYHMYTSDSFGINYSGTGNTNTGNTTKTVSKAGDNYLLKFANSYNYNDPTQDYITITTNSNETVACTLNPDSANYGIEHRMNFTLLYENVTAKDVPAYVSVVRSSEPQNAFAGTETIKIRFEDPRWSIPGNSYLVLGVQTSNITGRYAAMPAIYNNAVFTPNDDDYDEGLVTKGENIRNEDGDNAGVTASSYVSVDISYPTDSLKKIIQKDNPANHATSSSASTKILLPSRDSVVTYMLQVNSSVTKDMKKLVLIDNLPEKNDEVTISSGVPRGSQFKMSLCENPNFTLTARQMMVDESGVPQLDGSGNQITRDYVIPADKVKVQYSKKVDFDNQDWSGNNESDWTTIDNYTSLTSEQLENARSLRVLIDDVIPKNSVISFSFDAITDKSSENQAAPGETAWNSFGYQYVIEDDDGMDQSLFAAPLKVGATMASVPYLQKKLINSRGEEVIADKDRTFGFVIYEGEPINFSSYTKEQVLGTLLLGNGRKATYVELTVKQGESISDRIPMSGLKQYAFRGSYNPTDTDWQWEFTVDSETGSVIPGTYSIVEVDANDDYEYSSTAFGSKVTKIRNSSFEYNPGSNLYIRYTDERSNWGIRIAKMDDAESRLPGALFGLYSPNAGERMLEDDVRRVLTAARVPSSHIPDYEIDELTDKMTISVKGETYYLTKLAVTGSNGQISWADTLVGDKYILTELRPPDGYYIDKSASDYTEYREILYNASEMMQEFTYTNIAGSELPATGGSGMENAVKLLGIMLMAFAVMICGGRMLRKRIKWM